MTQKEELKESIKDLTDAVNVQALGLVTARLSELITRAGNTETRDGSVDLDLYFRARVIEETVLKLVRVIGVLS